MRCTICLKNMTSLYFKTIVKMTGVHKCKKCSRKQKLTDYVCDHCGELKQSRKGFLSHIERHRSYTCDACSIVPRSRYDFKKHLRMHFEFSVCDLCGLKFDNPKKFERHVASHDPSYVGKGKFWAGNIGTFNCNFCPKVFDKLSNRNSHQVLIHKDGPNESRFKCKHCNEQFYSREDLRLHDFTHYKGKTFHCEFQGCKMFFKERKTRKFHMLSHFPPKFECAKCGHVSSFTFLNVFVD